MAITLDRVLAVVVLAAIAVLYALWSNIADDQLTSAAVGAIISLPGLVVVWFRESLAQTSFARGIARKSPPGLVAALGWLLLVAVPLLILWQVQ